MTKKHHWVVTGEMIDGQIVWKHVDADYWDYDEGFPEGTMLVDNGDYSQWQIIREAEDYDNDSLMYDDLAQKLGF